MTKKRRTETKQLNTESFPSNRLQSNKPAVPSCPLAQDEKELIEKWEHLNEENKIYHCFSVENDGSKDNLIIKTRSENGSKKEQFELVKASVCKLTGVKDFNLALELTQQSLFACGSYRKCKVGDLVGLSEEGNNNLTVFNALKPQDEYEALLITRMIPLHFQIMEFMKRTILQDQCSQAIDLNINRVAKLTRLYNESFECLMRYRRKGEQRVVVQHVNVNDGGKAIVGGSFETAAG